MKTVLSIAGFDPSSGAGVTADLMVFAAHGLFGTSCITGLTVQSTRGVRSTHPVAAEVLRDTLACLQEDLPPAGVKIGMLSTVSAVAAVADFLEALRSTAPHIPVVLDPVLRSSSGRELLEPEGMDLLHSRLLPLVDWVTPNLSELAILTGLSVQNRDDIEPAARVLQMLKISSNTFTHRNESLNLNVFATGGHLNPPDDLLLQIDTDAIWLPGQLIVSSSTHGTGCALSSALLSRLVLGDEPYAAALAAKQFVAQAIRTATPIGHGRGPLNHLWPLEMIPINHR